MKGYETQLVQFMTGADNRFAIPVYQRKYDWRIENCKQLYDDLVRVVRNKRINHFFGSIVSETNPDGYKNERVIIDGQQRLTTVSLLLLAIYNLLSEGVLKSNNEYLRDKILEEYLVDKYETGENRIKLIPVKDDREALARLYDTKSEKIADSNLTINYDYFYERLKREEVSIDEMYDAICKLQVINLTLNADDNAQLIFESLNSTGKDLSEADKIRNYVLMGMTPKKQNELYNTYWNKVEKLTGENLDLFSRDYLSVKTQSIPSFSKVYPAFKSYVEDNQIEIEELLSDFYNYSVYYNRLLNGGTNSKKINGSIDRLNRVETSVVRPFFLEVLRYLAEEKIDIKDAEEIFEYTENYIFRRIICEITTGALNKIFLTLNKDIIRLDGTTDNYVEKFKHVLSNKRDSGRFPDNEEFIRELKNKQVYMMRSKNKAYLFERFENYGTVEDKDIYRHLDEGDYSIEHIMPQHLTPQWINDLGENYEEIHETWLHRLANLTLTAYNSNYSNDTFERKKTMKNGFLDSGLRMNQKVAQYEKWTLAELEDRNDYMAEKALDIWKYPDTDYVPPVKELDTATLDDDIDLAGRKIAKFRFGNTEQPVDSWVDMFEKVVKILYEGDKSIITRIASSGDVSFISNNKSELSVPTEIDNGIYLEKHGNTEAKITNLSKLFRMYNVELDNLMFYLKDEEETEVSDKKQRHKIRRAYWTYALPIIQEANKESGCFNNVHPGRQNWVSGWFGISGCSVNAIANFNHARTELYFSTSDAEKNKRYYDMVYKHKDEIESALGREIEWDRGDGSKYSRLSVKLDDVSVSKESDWSIMAKFHAEWSEKFVRVVVPIIKNELGIE